MKTKILLIPTLFLLGSSLCGCKEINDGFDPNSKVNIDFGVYRSDTSSLPELKIDLSYDELSSRFSHKESFVFAVYNDLSCSCWSTDFAPVLREYNAKHNMDIQAISVNQFDNKNDKLGVYLVGNDMPSIVVVKRGRIVIQSSYGRDNKNIFKNVDKFEEFLHKHINLPKMYSISKTDLDSFIENDKEFNLYVTKNGCPDCSRVVNAVLTKWSDSVDTVNKPLYIFDIQPYNYKDTHKDYWYDEENAITTYQHIKDIYGLSEKYNETLGWKTGYVPTFQNRKGSTINDMITVNNDSYDAENKVITSYFTEKRLQYMAFLKDSDIEDKVLDQMDIEFTNWKEQKERYEADFVNPITRLFIETYVK